METFSLADNAEQSLKKLGDWKPDELYRTRLVRADLPLTRPRAPLLKFFHTNLRRFWYRVRNKRAFYEQRWREIVADEENPMSSPPAAESHEAMPHDDAQQQQPPLPSLHSPGFPSSTPTKRPYRTTPPSFTTLPPPHQLTYQDTHRLALLLFNFVIALLAGTALIIPLCILSYQHSRAANLITVSVAIVLFSFVIAFFVQTTGPETLAASAAYAAVLVVFLGNTPTAAGMATGPGAGVAGRVG
jgi:hypothetical protein